MPDPDSSCFDPPSPGTCPVPKRNRRRWPAATVVTGGTLGPAGVRNSQGSARSSWSFESFGMRVRLPRRQTGGSPICVCRGPIRSRHAVGSGRAGPSSERTYGRCSLSFGRGKLSCARIWKRSESGSRWWSSARMRSKPGLRWRSGGRWNGPPSPQSWRRLRSVRFVHRTDSADDAFSLTLAVRSGAVPGNRPGPSRGRDSGRRTASPAPVREEPGSPETRDPCDGFGVRPGLG